MVPRAVKETDYWYPTGTLGVFFKALLLLLFLVMLCCFGFIIFHATHHAADASAFRDAQIEGLRWSCRFLLCLTLAFALAVTAFFKRRQVLETYPRVRAYCTKRSVVGMNDPDGITYTIGMICRFEFSGRVWEVTPYVSAVTWAFPGWAKRYLESRVSKTGECELAVNPDNALETYLLPWDIRSVRYLPLAPLIPFALLCICAHGAAKLQKERDFLKTNWHQLPKPASRYR